MAKAIPSKTINPDEAAHFGQLAADWWNPAGTSAMLHKLNPVRLAFIRSEIDRHWGGDDQSFRPLAQKSALDVGCGAGLLCEPLARLGASVTGVDAAPENIAAAAAHAQESGLSIAYHAGEVGGLSGAFDLVTSMEVVEHVNDPAVFLAQLTERLAIGGLLILSTPNRTRLSQLAMITLGEGLGAIPKGTHDWDKFLTPDEVTQILSTLGFRIETLRGIAFSPTKGLHISDDLSLNYMLSATRV